MTILIAFTTAIAMTFAGVTANNTWRLEKVELEPPESIPVKSFMVFSWQDYFITGLGGFTAVWPGIPSI